ncbi:MAG: hypothetical protein J07HX64_00674 [halophilic archaeon J07HX64]|nr:MAG: hypothetical protein J07HX64_00674 [halophilic archaeon J07HX64]
MLRDTVSLPAGGLVSAVRAGAFWGVAALPLVYLPILAVGLDSRPEQLLFVSLLSLNVVPLIVGHPHRTS